MKLTLISPMTGTGASLQDAVRPKVIEDYSIERFRLIRDVSVQIEIECPDDIGELIKADPEYKVL